MAAGLAASPRYSDAAVAGHKSMGPLAAVVHISAHVGVPFLYRDLVCYWPACGGFDQPQLYLAGPAVGMQLTPTAEGLWDFGGTPTATGEFRLGFVYIDSFTGPTLFQLVIVTVTP